MTGKRGAEERTGEREKGEFQGYRMGYLDTILSRDRKRQRERERDWHIHYMSNSIMVVRVYIMANTSTLC